MNQRGVVLAGGKGTRLGELTRATNKHLLPVGPEPMVYHPLRKLIGAGIRDILLIAGPDQLGDFCRQLGSGTRFGCSLTYQVQDEAAGIAQGLSLTRDYCRGGPCLLLLGDNVFFDPLAPLLQKAADRPGNAWITLKKTTTPSSFGIAELHGGKIVSIEEKPAHPRGDHAIPGIYFLPALVFTVIDAVRPSARGELEITDVCRAFLDMGRLSHIFLEGYWTDAGTPETLALANRLVRENAPLY